MSSNSQKGARLKSSQQQRRLKFERRLDRSIWPSGDRLPNLTPLDKAASWYVGTSHQMYHTWYRDVEMSTKFRALSDITIYRNMLRFTCFHCEYNSCYWGGRSCSFVSCLSFVRVEFKLFWRTSPKISKLLKHLSSHLNWCGNQKKQKTGPFNFKYQKYLVLCRWNTR